MNIKVYSEINQPPVYAICKLAKKLHNDAIVVTGENSMNFCEQFLPKEQQWYNNLITKYKDMILPFFFYNQHIVYEILVGINHSGYTKEKFYDIPWRHKIRTRRYISQSLEIKLRRYYEICRYQVMIPYYFKFLPSKLLK